MSKHDKPARAAGSKEGRGNGWSELTDAAAALARDLARFEELTTAASKAPLDTRKSIERAAKTTTEAAEEHERVNESLRALVEVINVARVRHEANAATLAARGEQIRLRADELEALYVRYSALGEEGRDINQLVLEASARQREATTPERVRELISAVEAIEARMSHLVEGARSLGQAASSASISDIADQADALRQQAAAARNKLGLLRKGLEAKLPDPSTLN